MLSRLRKLVQERRSALEAAVAVLVGLGFALYALWPTFHARFGFIDDHEIATFLGPEHHVHFWRELMATEVGSPFHRARFRPSYYVLRLIETKLWGFHAGVWYFAHACMFGLGLAAVLWVLRRKLSFGENLVLVVFLATLGLWGDVFARLGPGEIYLVLGSGLYACGVALALERRDRAAAVLLVLGGLIAVGSKENFVVLALPSVILGVVALRRRAWGLAAANVVVVLYAIGVAAVVAVGVKNVGHVYLEDVSAHGRVELLRVAAGRVLDATRRWMIVAAAVFAVAWILARRRGTIPEVHVAFLRFVLAEGGLALLWIGQVVFYNASWPDGMVPRYGFPGVLVPAFALYVAVLACDRLLRAVGVPVQARAVLRLAFAAYACVAWVPRTLPLRAAAQHTRDETEGLGAHLDRVIETVSREPERPIVVDTYNVWDFEPIHSLQEFLLYARVRNPTFVRAHYAPRGYGRGSIEAALAKDTVELHDRGNGRLYRPWRELRPGPCFGVAFAGVPEPGCTSLGQLR